MVEELRRKMSRPTMASGNYEEACLYVECWPHASSLQSRARREIPRPQVKAITLLEGGLGGYRIWKLLKVSFPLGESGADRDNEQRESRAWRTAEQPSAIPGHDGQGDSGARFMDRDPW